MVEKRERILSGMRPTGRLHIGHWCGALENWVKLQERYKTFFLIADYHSLTTNLDSSEIHENTLEMLKDWIAAGINPEVSPVFRQSAIKEHAELHLIFSMLVTKARLERNPSLKEQIRDLNIENISYGHLGYPVLQAADILLYKGEKVPVGEDQAPHVELTREIARKFNTTYGKVFPEPETLLTTFARLPGLDGKAKMSKSLGNTVLLSDSPEEIYKKIRRAFTDPQKLRKGDPGRPEICLIYTYHKKFNPAEAEEIARECRKGTLGCVADKERIATAIADYFQNFRQKRAELEKRKDLIMDILRDGEQKAREVARETMHQVHEAMNMGL